MQPCKHCGEEARYFNSDGIYLCRQCQKERNVFTREVLSAMENRRRVGIRRGARHAPVS